MNYYADRDAAQDCVVNTEIQPGVLDSTEYNVRRLV